MSYSGIGAASTMFEYGLQMCMLIDIVGLKRATSVMKFSYPFARSGQSIGLLGGSFDPAHAGHAHITREALKRFGLDRLWWMVSPGNPLKDRGPAPIEQRMKRAQIVMDHPRVEVTDIERHLGTRYTAQTLQALQVRYRGVRFVWLMGADNLAEFHLWQDWRWIMENVAIGVLARPRDCISARMSPAARQFRAKSITGRHSHMLSRLEAPAWCFVNVPMINQSSTAIRAGGGWRA